GRVLGIVFLVPLASLAQEDSKLASKIEAVRFPPLARQARIQGDIRLRSGPDGVTLVTGHPILAPVAVANLKELGKLSEIEIEVIYHFVFAAEPDFRVTRLVVKKGNRFERVILHALMMKTEKIVEGTECTENPNRLKNRIDLTKNPIEVWIYGAI